VRLRLTTSSPRRLRPRLERHELGPRVYFLGYRLHEWHLGVGIMVVLAVGVAAGVHDALPTLLAAAAGVWLVAKDCATSLRPGVPGHGRGGSARAGGWFKKDRNAKYNA
jgi:hypothetical protein